MVAPDGKGVLTEYRPSHHLHQTGIFWGLKMVNGRDFFMKWQGDYYRRVSASIVQPTGRQVKWQTVYDMLGEDGKTHGRKAKVSNRTRETRPSGIIGGPRETWPGWK